MSSFASSAIISEARPSNTPAPSFSDLEISEELSLLERVVQYTVSSIPAQRLVHVKLLHIAAQISCFNEVQTKILPLLSLIVSDHECIVRQHFAEQLALLSLYFNANQDKNGYRYILESILPHVAQLLADEKGEVRDSAVECLLKIVELLKPADQLNHALMISIKLANDEKEELRMNAVALLCQLTHPLGKELCCQFIIPEIVSLAEDPVFRVRKAVAINIHHILQIADPENVISRLFPMFVHLAKDEMYRVRTACVDNIIEVYSIIKNIIPFQEFYELFKQLLTENNKHVRHSSMHQIGKFIAMIEDSQSVPDDLFEQYVNLSGSATKIGPLDDSLRLACAYAIPGVMKKIGPDQWDRLSFCYFQLSGNLNPQVRFTLACSLHEMAAILGPQQTQSELLQFFDLFLKDEENEVRIGVVRYLSKFLVHISEPCRESYLNECVEILKTAPRLNWRFRLELSKQLPLLCSLFSPKSVYSVIFPVVLELLLDDVMAVSTVTVQVVTPLLLRVSEESNEAQLDVTTKLVAFSRSPRYASRELFVLIAQAVLNEERLDRTLTSTDFLPSLFDLASDSVLCIKMALAKTLSTIPKWTRDDSRFWDTVEALQNLGNKHISDSLSSLYGSVSNECAQLNQKEGYNQVSTKSENDNPLISKNEQKEDFKKLESDKKNDTDLTDNNLNDANAFFNITITEPDTLASRNTTTNDLDCHNQPSASPSKGKTYENNKQEEQKSTNNPHLQISPNGGIIKISENHNSLNNRQSNIQRNYV